MAGVAALNKMADKHHLLPVFGPPEAGQSALREQANDWPRWLLAGKACVRPSINTKTHNEAFADKKPSFFSGNRRVGLLCSCAIFSPQHPMYMQTKRLMHPNEFVSAYRNLPWQLCGDQDHQARWSTNRDVPVRYSNHRHKHT